MPSMWLQCQSSHDRTNYSRYISVKPASICIGDLVELQVSFIMVPLRDNKFKGTMVLRSILVLDRTYTQVKATCINWSYAQTFQYFFRKLRLCVSHSKKHWSLANNLNLWSEEWATLKRSSAQRRPNWIICKSTRVTERRTNSTECWAQARAGACQIEIHYSCNLSYSSWLYNTLSHDT